MGNKDIVISLKIFTESDLNELLRRSVLVTEAGVEGLQNDFELSVFLNMYFV